MGLTIPVTDSIRESYLAEGYAIARQIFRLDHLVMLSQALHSVLNKSTGGSDHDCVLEDLILKSECLDHNLVYTAMKSVGSSAAAYQVLGSSQIFDVVSSVTAFDRAALHVMPMYVVIQLPSDGRFDYGWHQDGSYHDWCQDLVVLWFPVNRSTNGDMGTISVIPGSHLYGRRETDTYMKHGTFKQMQPKLRDDEVAREKVLEINLGDCCIMNGHTVHRSVLNRSVSPRVAGVLRITDLNTLQSYDPERFRAARKS